MAQVETALATGHRVLAVDPFYFGESKIAPRDMLYALLAAAVGEFKPEPVSVQSIGPLRQTDPLPSLHEVIRANWSVDQKPELFCFGRLETFDVPQLKQLAGPERLW